MNNKILIKIQNARKSISNFCLFPFLSDFSKAFLLFFHVFSFNKKGDKKRVAEMIEILRFIYELKAEVKLA